MKYYPIIALDADLTVPLDAKFVAVFWKGNIAAMK